MQVRFEIGGEIADQLLEVAESRPEGRNVLRMRLPELNEVVLVLDVLMLKPAAQLVDPQMLLVVDGISDPMQDLVVQLLRSGTDDGDHLASDIIDTLSNTLLKFGKRRLQFPALIDQQFNGDAVVEPARENNRIRRVSRKVGQLPFDERDPLAECFNVLADGFQRLAVDLDRLIALLLLGAIGVIRRRFLALRLGDVGFEL